MGEVPETLSIYEHSRRISREVLERAPGARGTEGKVLREIAEDINRREGEIVDRLAEITQAIGEYRVTLGEEIRRSTSQMLREHSRILGDVYRRLTTTLVGAGAGALRVRDVREMVGAVQSFIQASEDIGRSAELTEEIAEQLRQTATEAGEFLTGIRRGPPRAPVLPPEGEEPGAPALQPVRMPAVIEEGVRHLEVIEGRVVLISNVLKQGFGEQGRAGERQEQTAEEREEQRKEHTEEQFEELGHKVAASTVAMGLLPVALAGALPAALAAVAGRIGFGIGEYLEKRFNWGTVAVEFWQPFFERTGEFWRDPWKGIKEWWRGQTEETAKLESRTREKERVELARRLELKPEQLPGELLGIRGVRFPVPLSQQQLLGLERATQRLTEQERERVLKEYSGSMKQLMESYQVQRGIADPVRAMMGAGGMRPEETQTLHRMLIRDVVRKRVQEILETRGAGAEVEVQVREAGRGMEAAVRGAQSVEKLVQIEGERLENERRRDTDLRTGANLQVRPESYPSRLEGAIDSAATGTLGAQQ